jgi:hypothetical protein
VENLLIRQLLVEYLNRNSANIHKTPRDIILKRNKEEKYRVPKKTRRSMQHKKERNTGEKRNIKYKSIKRRQNVYI